MFGSGLCGSCVSTFGSEDASFTNLNVVNNETVGGNLTVGGTITGGTFFPTITEIPDGKISAPSFTFINDPSTGFFRDTTSGTDSSIGFSTAGTQRMTLNDAFLNSNVPVYITEGKGSSPSLSFATDTSTGIFRDKQGGGSGVGICSA